MVFIGVIDLSRRSTREEIVEQSERVVPFERYVFVGKPSAVRCCVRVDQERGEESVESWEEKWKVGQSRVLDLDDGYSVLAKSQCGLIDSQGTGPTCRMFYIPAVTIECPVALTLPILRPAAWCFVVAKSSHIKEYEITQLLAAALG